MNPKLKLNIPWNDDGHDDGYSVTVVVIVAEGVVVAVVVCEILTLWFSYGC